MRSTMGPSRAALSIRARPAAFDGWNSGARAETLDAVVAPRTWLLRIGWRKHGLLDPRDGPH